MKDGELQTMAEVALAALQDAGIWLRDTDPYMQLEAMMDFLEEHGPDGEGELR